MHHSIDYQLESQDSDRTPFEAGRTALCSSSERIVCFSWRSNDLDEVVSDHHSVKQRSQECMDDDDIYYFANKLDCICVQANIQCQYSLQTSISRA